MPFEDRCRSMIIREEGSISHMYLDTRGFVTVAVGQLLPTVESAQKLDFIHRDTGVRADAAEIALDYQTVRLQPAGKIASFYKPFTKLDLPEHEIVALLNQRIGEFEADLRTDFPDFDNFPEAAKLGLMDMVFNLGNAGLVNKFPIFTKAAQAQNWAVCALECQRRGISAGRNAMTKSFFEEASTAQS